VTHMTDKEIKPYWQEDGNQIWVGNSRDILKLQPKESVHMCCCSPPYWGLRDYDTTPQVWDDPGNCKHVWENKIEASSRHRNMDAGSEKQFSNKGASERGYARGQFCQHCNAWRGSLGLEPDPNDYIRHLVQIFDEVKRVLHPTGTLWIVIADSYAGGGRAGKHGKAYGGIEQNRTNADCKWGPPTGRLKGIKPKDMVGIPWMLAFALRDAGWWLRKDIIWRKDNPMPGSQTDRPTTSKEYVFLLSKSQRYFYDHEAIKEPYTEPINRWGGTELKQETIKHSTYQDMQGLGGTSILRAGRNMRPDPGGKTKRDVWSAADNTILLKWLSDNHPDILSEFGEACRLKDDIWNVSTKAFHGAHFAVYCPKLIAPAVLAGSSERGVCPDCLSPWERIVDRRILEELNEKPYHENGQMGGLGVPARHGINHSTIGGQQNKVSFITIGWAPTCSCYGTDPLPAYPRKPKEEPDVEYTNRTRPILNKRIEMLDSWKGLKTIPAIVLDPFFGSGTSGYVANKFGRKFIGSDLSEKYIEDIAIPRVEGEIKQRSLF